MVYPWSADDFSFFIWWYDRHRFYTFSFRIMIFLRKRVETRKSKETGYITYIWLKVNLSLSKLLHIQFRFRFSEIEIIFRLIFRNPRNSEIQMRPYLNLRFLITNAAFWIPESFIWIKICIKWTSHIISVEFWALDHFSTMTKIFSQTDRH